MITWSRVLEILRTSTPLGYFMQARDPRDSVTFTIAMIALAAKLAKSDGRVKRREIEAFREIFTIEPDQEEAVGRSSTSAARTSPAMPIMRARSFACSARAPHPRGHHGGALHIAVSDGGYHPEEDEYLDAVAGIFGLSPACVARLKARYVPNHWDLPGASSAWITRPAPRRSGRATACWCGGTIRTSDGERPARGDARPGEPPARRHQPRLFRDHLQGGVTFYSSFRSGEIGPMAPVPKRDTENMVLYQVLTRRPNVDAYMGPILSLRKPP